MDMILMRTREKYPNCKVILSHAGGALPYLITRVATPMRKAPGFMANHRMGTTHEKVMEAFRSFHFDLALSSSPSVLRMALEMVPHDRILYVVSARLFYHAVFDGVLIRDRVISHMRRSQRIQHSLKIWRGLQ